MSKANGADDANQGENDELPQDRPGEEGLQARPGPQEEGPEEACSGPEAPPGRPQVNRTQELESGRELIMSFKRIVPVKKTHKPAPVAKKPAPKKHTPKRRPVAHHG
jgi:hypothetical protein